VGGYVFLAAGGAGGGARDMRLLWVSAESSKVRIPHEDSKFVFGILSGHMGFPV
jgi:hypothetical protein